MTTQDSAGGNSGDRITSGTSAATQAISETVERVLGLEEEREVSGTATIGDEALGAARAALHAWVETVTAAIAVPGSGRVTLIHANGRTSAIASAELAYELSPRVHFVRD